MPTNKNVISIILDDDTLNRITEFQFNNRFRTRSAAVIFIINEGMKHLAAEYPELDTHIKLETGKKAPVDGLNEKRVHL